MAIKIDKLWRKPGVPGFLVDVLDDAHPGTTRRWHFSDDMLEGDKYLEEIQRIIDEERAAVKAAPQTADVPGAPAEDPLMAAHARSKGKIL